MTLQIAMCALADEEAPLTFKSKGRRSDRRSSKADRDSAAGLVEASDCRSSDGRDALCLQDHDAAQQLADRQRIDAAEQAVSSHSQTVNYKLNLAYLTICIVPLVL